MKERKRKRAQVVRYYDAFPLMSGSQGNNNLIATSHLVKLNLRIKVLREGVCFFLGSWEAEKAQLDMYLNQNRDKCVFRLQNLTSYRDLAPSTVQRRY